MARCGADVDVTAREEWLAALPPLAVAAAMAAGGIGGALTWVFAPVALASGLWLYARAPSRGFIAFCYICLLYTSPSPRDRG